MKRGKPFRSAMSLMIAVLISAATLYWAPPVHAIVYCHDYSLYRVTCDNNGCEDKNNIPPGAFRSRLQELGYGRFPITATAGDPELADLVLKPGDVIILGDSHSGYVNADYRIDHFIQVYGESGRIRDANNLPRHPLPDGRPGGLFLGDSFADFFGRLSEQGRALVRSIEVWRRTKQGQAPDKGQAGAATFSGEWDAVLHLAYKVTVQLTQSGNNVTGKATKDGNVIGTIQGTVSGNKLMYTWSFDGKTATGEVTLSAGGKGFSGHYDNPKELYGGQRVRFIGSRKGPVPSAEGGEIVSEQRRNPRDITGDWEDTTVGFGASTFNFRPLGGGRYEFRQTGFGNATGTAAVTGTRLRIDWTCCNRAYAGYWEYDLDPTSGTGEGTLVITRGSTAGTYKARIHRIR